MTSDTSAPAAKKALGKKDRTASGTWSAVRLGPDKNPANGEIIASATVTGSTATAPAEIEALWKPGEVAICWNATPKPKHQMTEAGKASLRRKALRRRLESKHPLLADLLEQQEHEARPEYFAGKPYEG